MRKLMLEITGCDDPQMWYHGMVGKKVPYHGAWPEAFISIDSGGYTNRVEFKDAKVVTVIVEDGDEKL